MPLEGYDPSPLPLNQQATRGIELPLLKFVQAKEGETKQRNRRSKNKHSKLTKHPKVFKFIAKATRLRF
jgi:hypothetical protein